MAIKLLTTYHSNGQKHREWNYKDSKRFIETNFSQAIKDIFS